MLLRMYFTTQNIQRLQYNKYLTHIARKCLEYPKELPQNMRSPWIFNYLRYPQCISRGYPREIRKLNFNFRKVLFNVLRSIYQEYLYLLPNVLRHSTHIRDKNGKFLGHPLLSGFCAQEVSVIYTRSEVSLSYSLKGKFCTLLIQCFFHGMVIGVITPPVSYSYTQPYI